MPVFKTPTLTSLHNGLIRWMATTDNFDVRTGSDFQFHDIIAHADSMEFEADLRDFWVDEKRWNRMVREYIDPTLLDKWIEGSKQVKNRIAVLRLGEGVKSHTNKGAQWRVWGACMLEVGYRENPRPHITLISRTSYLGYLSVLDLSIPYVLQQYIGDQDCSFTWHLMSGQMSWMKALGYLIKLYPEEVLEGKPTNAPALKKAQAQMAKLLKLDEENKHYGQMLYNPERRLRRRYHTEVLGYEEAQKWEGSRKTKRTNETYHYKAFHPLISCPVNTLSLDVI